MSAKNYQADVVIVGGGIAGIVTALELLNYDKKVLILDRDKESEFGGLAKWSFGGMFFVDTPEQRRLGMKDSVDVALRDWLSVAEFGPEDVIQRQWAEQYVNSCTEHGYYWLKKHGIGYFPVVHWVERGLYKPGNSFPRFHMVWGTGDGLTKTMRGHLLNHPKAKTHLQLYFRHRGLEITQNNGRVTGISGIDESDNTDFTATGDITVVATGGMGGDLEKVRKNWHKSLGTPPEVILNGSHEYALGDMHEAAEKINANITHLDWHWPYAAGVHHPRPRKELHGLSLVPPKSALWLDHTGKRFGPMPLITAYDTKWTVEEICKQDKKYSWQVLNLKIANKEFAISGAEFNEAIRDKSIVGFLKTILLGNKKLVKDMLDNCIDFVTADTIEELVQKMNALQGTDDVKLENVREAITRYDEMIDRGPKYHDDEQLRRIAHARQYRGDKVRTLKFQKINEKSAGPLIAIREFILSRKTMGGIQTNLQSQVLDKQQQPIEGLYAVGEASGFGGGGSHGIGALEGTFLGGCVLTGRIAAKHISGGNLV